jgi:hypothetical protein
MNSSSSSSVLCGLGFGESMARINEQQHGQMNSSNTQYGHFTLWRANPEMWVVQSLCGLGFNSPVPFAGD